MFVGSSIIQEQLQIKKAASKSQIRMDRYQQLINTDVYLLHESVQNRTA